MHIVSFGDNCVFWWQFAGNVNAYFQGKNKKSVISFSPVEFSQTVVKVKQLSVGSKFISKMQRLKDKQRRS